MLNRYKVRLIKRYDFELDGKDENDIRQQVDYIQTQTKILDLPSVKKTIRVKVKKINEGRNKNAKTNY